MSLRNIAGVEVYDSPMSLGSTSVPQVASVPSSMQLVPTDVSLVQRAMWVASVTKGIPDPGAVDGRWGPRTGASLTAYLGRYWGSSLDMEIAGDRTVLLPLDLQQHLAALATSYTPAMSGAAPGIPRSAAAGPLPTADGQLPALLDSGSGGLSKWTWLAIGAGVLGLAGLGYWWWKKRK